MTSVIIKDYSAYSFVVYGDTKIHKDKLKELGGRYNGKLSVGPGWVFSLDKKDVVQEWYDNLKLNADSGIVDSRDKIIEELKKENAELKKELDVFRKWMSDLGYHPSQIGF
jgi:hypothetical protein